METSSLYQESGGWKKTADELLRESGLISQLNSLGEVEFTGSYELDLMMSGDIDIYLLSDKDPKALAPEIIAEVIKSDFWNYYVIYDWLHFDHVGFPKSYYVGLQRKDYKGNPWKVDIWIFKEFPQDSLNYMSNLKKTLNNENREVILSLKKHAKEVSPKLQSTVIYDAVINKGAKELSEIQAC